MSAALPLTEPALAELRDARPRPSGEPSVRIAHHHAGDEPPVVHTVSDPDPLEVIEAVCALTEEHSAVPTPAIRELVENLVHADFTDALVTIADGGGTLRVSDHGSGISDPDRALQPGFSSAGSEQRAVVRGVGGGLPLAARLVDEAGGTLAIETNLGGGAVVTAKVPPNETTSEPLCSETARLLMALLVELGQASAAQLAQELGRSRAECGRELALLQHRGLVVRTTERRHTLTEAGTALLATLF